MQQPQQLLENGIEDTLYALFSSCVITVKIILGHLDIPVTEIVPGKRIESAGGLVELVIFQRLGCLADRLFQTRQNPAVGIRQLGTLQVDSRRVKPFKIHQGETAGVPELVAEVTIARDSFSGELDIAPHGRK